MWLFGQFAATGSSTASYQQAEEPVSQLINDLGRPWPAPPPPASEPPLPFVELERDLWDLRDAAGQQIGPGRTRAPRLATGPRSRRPPASTRRTSPGQPEDPGGRHPPAPGSALHPPVLAELICTAVDLDLDVPALDPAATGGPAQPARLRPRRRGFAEEVLRAYAYQCAMCGFDGALGRYPVGIEAAHVRWHSQQGPDEIANALTIINGGGYWV